MNVSHNGGVTGEVDGDWETGKGGQCVFVKKDHYMEGFNLR